MSATTQVGTLNFSGSQSFTLGTAGSPVYLNNSTPLTSTSTVTQTLGGHNYRAAATGNATFTNNGAGLIDFNVDVLKENAAGGSGSTDSGNLVFAGTGNFEALRLGKRYGNLQAGLTKQGTGTLTIQSAYNTFDTSGVNVTGLTGPITIANGGGTLRIEHVSALGTGNISVQTGGTNSGTLELALTGTNAFNSTFNGFASTTSLNGGGQAQIVNTSGNNTISSNLTVTTTGGNGLNVASNGGLLTLAGNITTTIDAFRLLSLGGTGDGVVSGNILNFGALNFSVDKVGSGQWSLTGAGNTYTGTTNVRSGTLLANGTLAASPIVVHGGATFGGTGAVGGTITVNGGTLAPGASIESLVGGTLTLNNGSTFEYEFDTSAAPAFAGDLQVVNGNLNLNGTVALDLVDLALAPDEVQPGYTLSLINYSGAWNGGLFTYNGNTLENGEALAVGSNLWRIVYNSPVGGSNFTGDYLAGGLFVNITALPEPTSAIIWFGAAAAVLAIGWRQHRRFGIRQTRS